MGLAAAATPARGQGTAVQLPTFSFFNVSTTVSVPDGGSAFLGGVNRSAEGRNEFGVPGLPFPPFRNTSIGRDSSASGMRVTATIHDFDAMEAAILGQSPDAFAQSHQGGLTPGSLAGSTLPLRSPLSLAGSWAPKTVVEIPATASAGAAVDGAASTALEDAAARRVAQRQFRADEAERYFEHARQAEADGKPSVARIYYQMVARRASGDLKTQALARLEMIQNARATTKVVENGP
jgi:hypothetical protein